MNATGQSDLVNYVEMLEGMQCSMFDPKLRKLDKIIQKNYGIPEYDYEWNDLFPASEADRLGQLSTAMESLGNAIDKRLVSIPEARKILVEKFRYLEGMISPEEIPADLTPKPAKQRR